MSTVFREVSVGLELDPEVEQPVTEIVTRRVTRRVVFDFVRNSSNFL